MNYSEIPNYPASISGTNVLCRLMDGLAFRYYWATEGLTKSDMTFSPCASSMNMIQLLKHIYDLACVTDSVLNHQEIEKNEEIYSFEVIRKLTLHLYTKNRNEIIAMTDEHLATCKFKPKNKSVEYPIWHLINGPIADALTHVGQINSWRRIAGNPAPEHNPFLGR